MDTLDIEKWEYETEWLTEGFEKLHNEVINPNKFNQEEWFQAFNLLQYNLARSADDLNDSNPIAVNHWLHTRPRLHEYHEVMTRHSEELKEQWRGTPRPGVELTRKHFLENKKEFIAARNAILKVWLRDVADGAKKMTIECKSQRPTQARGLGIIGKDGKGLVKLIVFDKQTELAKEKERVKSLIEQVTILGEQTKRMEEEKNLGQSSDGGEADVEEGKIVETTAKKHDDGESRKETKRLEIVDDRC